MFVQPLHRSFCQVD